MARRYLRWRKVQWWLGGILTTFSATAALSTSVEDILERAKDVQVVVIGEVHDNPAHQQAQAAVASALTPRALVFEMFSPEDAALIERLRDLDTPTAQISARLGWDTSGWPDFERYYQVVLAAPKASILGAEVPTADLRASVAQGAAQSFGAEAEIYNLTQPLPASEQAAREARQATVHCDALPAEMLPGMVQAQRLRDAWLARAVIDGLAKPGPGPVLVVTGNGHAQLDWGLPAVLMHVRPDLSIYAHAQLEAEPDDAPFSGYSITTPVVRPDPCAAFQNR